MGGGPSKEVTGERWVCLFLCFLVIPVVAIASFVGMAVVLALPLSLPLYLSTSMTLPWLFVFDLGVSRFVCADFGCVF